MAYELAILEDDKLQHPAIEAVFTVDEEIGLLGASALDTAPLKGKYLINLDSEDCLLYTSKSSLPLSPLRQRISGSSWRSS